MKSNFLNNEKNHRGRHTVAISLLLVLFISFSLVSALPQHSPELSIDFTYPVTPTAEYNLSGEVNDTQFEIISDELNIKITWLESFINALGFWKSDGSSTATGSWDLGSYDLSSAGTLTFQNIKTGAGQNGVEQGANPYDWYWGTDELTAYAFHALEYITSDRYYNDAWDTLLASYNSVSGKWDMANVGSLTAGEVMTEGDIQFLGGFGDKQIYVGASDGSALSIQAGGTISNNGDGGALNLKSGFSRGDGSSYLTFQTVAPNQGAGSTQRNPITRWTVSNTGHLLGGTDGTGVYNILTAGNITADNLKISDWNSKADYSFGANNFTGTGNITTTGTGKFASVGFGTNPVTNQTLTMTGGSGYAQVINQGADSRGWRINGYDDESTKNFIIQHTGSGAVQLTSSHAFAMSGTGYFSMTASGASGDFYYTMGDAIGAKKAYFRNSAYGVVASIDSKGNIFSNSSIQGAFKSSDGTAGWTGNCINASYKNGLVVGCND